ncbi:MAG: phosphoribosyltransferase family protein [Bdellovibrionia bacterium]
MLPLTTFIHKKLIILNQHTTLFQATRTICDNHIGCVLVRDPEGNAAGIVTDRDFVCRGLLQNKTLESALEEIMSPNLMTANDDATLTDVIQLMERHGFRRIPIVHQGQNGKRKFVGLVTLDDLVISNQIETRTLSRIIQRQIGRRMVYLQELKAQGPQKSILRSEAHRLNTLHKFYAHIHRFINVDKDIIPALSQFILSFLVLRVTFTGAAHFVAQLPKLTQESLLKLPAGPDRSYSGKRLIEQLSNRFKFSEPQSNAIFFRFLLALSEWISVDALEKLKHQLPLEYHPFFEFAAQERKKAVNKEESNFEEPKQQPQPIPPAPDPDSPWNLPVSFQNRTQAAELLAQKLSRYKDKHPLIVGIPRGSVPMAKIIAEKLNGDLDVILVHKVGAPDNPEFAIGSVSEFGSIFRSEAAGFYGISPEYLEKAAQKEISRLRQRRQTYTPIRPPIDPKDRIVVIIDDGIATGSTMLAAIHALRSKNPKRIIVASPVASPNVISLLEKEADELAILETPEEFFSVGQFYEDFSQVNDEEIYRILSKVGAEKKPKAAVSSRKKTA